MRPVPKSWIVSLSYGKMYPADLQHLTQDGRHHGIDYATPLGTAGSSGVNGVLNHRGFLRGYGLSMIVKFWTGMFWWKKMYRAIMGHLSEVITSKKVGEKISKYENIYRTGNSGAAKGYHLHYEIQEYTKNGWVSVDPEFVVGG